MSLAARLVRPVFASASGTLSAPASITHANQDLTAAGFLDYISYANGFSDNRKNGANLIGGATATNSTRSNTGTTDTITLSWTDGNPTTSGSTNSAGLWAPGASADSLTDWTLPAGTALRKGGIIVGAYWDTSNNGTVSLRLTLSDASATEQLITVPMPQGSTGAPTFTYYEWTYNAAIAGQTLRVRVENLLANRTAGNGPQPFVTLIRYGT